MLRHTIRASRIVGGVVLILVGLVLALPGVPGPGLPVAFVGLTVLGTEFEWARTLRARCDAAVRRLVRRTHGG